jgi:N-acetylglucosaminyldiphosphoundecaprenol N-acetyl-beta-D-mannosaminyltransferase
VGGGFDFLTGKIRRAPKIFRTIGLEWLWRFLQEPRYRAKRIFRAVIVFPIRVIFDI